MATENIKLIEAEKAPEAPAGSITALPGVSDATRHAITEAGAGAKLPADRLNRALTELRGVIDSQPEKFRSSYLNELSGVMNGILGRKAFRYDIALDPMYRMYRDRHISAGRKAMEDSMGRSAALTGGYGSSYSASAGQQAYNEQLERLNDRIPELYAISRDAYDAEGDRLMQQYEMLSGAYQREYGAYQDEFDRWLSERRLAEDRYAAELDRDTALRLSETERAVQLEKLAQEQELADREYFYNMAMDMLENGKTPTESMLRSAGLSDEDIAQLKSGKKKKSSSSSSSSSSAKRSGSGYSSSGRIAEVRDKLLSMKEKYIRDR